MKRNGFGDRHPTLLPLGWSANPERRVRTQTSTVRMASRAKGVHNPTRSESHTPSQGPTRNAIPMKKIRAGSKRARSRRGIRSMIAISNATSKLRNPKVRNAMPAISGIVSSSDRSIDDATTQVPPTTKIDCRPRLWAMEGTTKAPATPTILTAKNRMLTAWASPSRRSAWIGMTAAGKAQHSIKIPCSTARLRA